MAKTISGTTEKHLNLFFITTTNINNSAEESTKTGCVTFTSFAHYLTKKESPNSTIFCHFQHSLQPCSQAFQYFLFLKLREEPELSLKKLLTAFYNRYHSDTKRSRASRQLEVLKFSHSQKTLSRTPMHYTHYRQKSNFLQTLPTNKTISAMYYENFFAPQ